MSERERCYNYSINIVVTRSSWREGREKERRGGRETGGRERGRDRWREERERRERGREDLGGRDDGREGFEQYHEHNI